MYTLFKEFCQIIPSLQMNKLSFTEDNGSEFYKDLNTKIEKYFSDNNIPKTGNGIMLFKILLYFGLDILFYSLMITSTTTLGFYIFYLLMGLSILLTAFNISHDAAHRVAVKSRCSCWGKRNFSKLYTTQSYRIQCCT